MAETQTVLWMRMLDRLDGPRPPRLVVVDPRRTAVAARADVHLPIRPGTNVALLNAILYEVIANGWVDHEWVRAHTAGYLPPHEPIDDDYPLQLTTGRTVYHWHTRTKTRQVGQLNSVAPHMWVELCPQDADRLGIGDSDLVRVESRHGAIQAPARLSGTRPGLVFAPFHYGYFDTAAGSGPDGAPTAANEATRTEWDPVSKQPIFKVTAVRVTKLADANSRPVPAPATAAAAATTETNMHTHGGPAANTAIIPGGHP